MEEKEENIIEGGEGGGNTCRLVSHCPIVELNK